MFQKFPQNVITKLKYYVYIYIDPRNDEIFYVGKGKGNRCFAHLSEESESEKVKRINNIKGDNKTPIIEMIIHGVDEDIALKVEASVIDLIDVKKLTNKVKGHSSSKIGRMSIDKLLSIYNPDDANITEPSILIKTTQTFSYGIAPNELYDATRQFWRLGTNREKVEYAFSVYDGIIQEVYSVISWHKAGSTFSSREFDTKDSDKWEFIGKIADEKIRKKYLYKSVSSITKYQSSFYYLNIDD